MTDRDDVERVDGGSVVAESREHVGDRATIATIVVAHRPHREVLGIHRARRHLETGRDLGLVLAGQGRRAHAEAFQAFLRHPQLLRLLDHLRVEHCRQHRQLLLLLGRGLVDVPRNERIERGRRLERIRVRQGDPEEGLLPERALQPPGQIFRGLARGRDVEANGLAVAGAGRTRSPEESEPAADRIAHGAIVGHQMLAVLEVPALAGLIDGELIVAGEESLTQLKPRKRAESGPRADER